MKLSRTRQLLGAAGGVLLLLLVLVVVAYANLTSIVRKDVKMKDGKHVVDVDMEISDLAFAR